MQTHNLVQITSAVLVFGWFCQASAANIHVTAAAGEIDRSESVVAFPLPIGLSGPFELRDATGGRRPIQTDAAGRGYFVLSQLAKGKSASFELTSGSSSATNMIQVAREGRKLKVTTAGKSILEYQAEPGDLPVAGIRPIFQRGGYMHPIFSPSGSLVSDDYPADHRHHHGIWFPWTKTDFEGRHPDFWNVGDGTGRVDFSALDKFWSGPVFGGFQVRHRFVDLTSGQPKVALNEVWEVRAYALGATAKPYWMFDLVSTQECASASALKLVEYRYGGLGFRGHADWIGKDKQPYLTSEGITNKLEGDNSRGRWCYIGGPVGGRQTGVAILGHPQNFRAPQPMRLNPDQPFFCFAPPQLGDFQIEPGKSYVSRYRFIVFDGPPERVEVDRLWQDYAHPVETKSVTVER